MESASHPGALLPVAAFVAIIDGHGRILMVAGEYDRKRYGLPGGGVEPGESPADAAVRELREEAGVDVGLEHLVGMFRFRGRLDFLAFVFRGTILAGTPHVSPGDEVIEVGWFDPGDLPAD